MASLFFSFFAILTVVCAIGVVASRNAINSAMCFLLCLAGVAGLFVKLQAFLLAFILILVYAGAVVALFLFIIMLLDVKGQEPPARRAVARLAAMVACVLVAAGLVSFGLRGRVVAQPAYAVAPFGASLKLYAYQLFTTYLLPVQVVGFLLLIAMLGVIVLSQRDKKSRLEP
jgi:NADH-quinone oxidoreductase subunit J